MVIQHNLSAMNAHRQLGINNGFTGRNLEKLSSGFRVNRAGNDAAGLAISEKMRGQIRGLGMAEQNSQHGISLIQTAEGALNETHAILQRLRELATQSSNGTYQEEVDRENLDKEAQALKSELDRIASSTHYNGIKLLNGSLSKSGNAVTTYGASANAAIPSAYAATSSITVTTGYNSVDFIWPSSSMNPAVSFTNGNGEEVDDRDFPDFDSRGMPDYYTEFLGEAPTHNDDMPTTPNAAYTVRHGEVAGTYDISLKIGLYEYKATVDKSATKVDLDYGGGFKNGGSTIRISIGRADNSEHTFNYRTIDSWAKDEACGALGEWSAGNTRVATAVLSIGFQDIGDGTAEQTTYAGTPAKPGSEVYNTKDTVKDSFGNEAFQRIGLTVGGFSGETPSEYKAERAMTITVSHSPTAGKYLVSFANSDSSWNWTAHVDGDESSFEVTMNGGPANGGSSFVMTVQNGMTLAEWAASSAYGNLGPAGSGKSASATTGALTFMNNGVGSLKTDGDPTDPTDPGDPGDPPVVPPVEPPVNPPVTPPVYPPVYGNALVLQIGANGAADQRVSLSIEDMSSKSLGTDTARVSDVSIATRQYANDAIAVIDAAINQVSGQRADLGAMQNRLEHTINNLGVGRENLTSAESTIRDADMAKEMMMFTKNNILTQGSQSMLAQANQLPQGVLQLLR